MFARAPWNSPASRLTLRRLIETRGSAGSATGERKPPPTGNHSYRQASLWAAASGAASDRISASPAVFSDVEHQAIGIVEFHFIKAAAVYRLSGPVRSS